MRGNHAVGGLYGVFADRPGGRPSTLAFGPDDVRLDVPVLSSTIVSQEAWRASPLRSTSPSPRFQALPRPVLTYRSLPKPATRSRHATDQVIPTATEPRSWSATWSGKVWNGTGAAIVRITS
jgi:hypothetical protein